MFSRLVEPFLESAGLGFPELDLRIRAPRWWPRGRFDGCHSVSSFGPHGVRIAVESGQLSVLIGDPFALGVELSSEPFWFGVVSGEAFPVGALSLGL